MGKVKSQYGFFTGLAEGLNKGVDRHMDYKMKLAEYELAKQAKAQEEAQARQDRAFGSYLTLRKDSAASVRPRLDVTGRPIADAKGNPVYETFQPIPEAEVRQGVDYLRGINPQIPAYGGQGQRPAGAVPQPKSNNGIASTPDQQLRGLDYMEGLLNNIGTDVPSIGTAAISKVLGGQRGGFGSDAIKEYEDAKPGAAVGAYRAITGDTRLSDSDAQQRALPFMPSVYPVMDTATVRAGKLARLRRALQLSGAQRQTNPNAEVDFGSVMTQAAKEIPIQQNSNIRGRTPQEEAEYQRLLGKARQ